MDLSRAKTILIMAFLVLNFFLGLLLWQNPRNLRVQGGLTAEEAEQAKTALREAGFELQTALPRQTPRLSLLHVSRPPLNEDNWAARFWPGGGAQKRTASPGETYFVKGQEQLKINASGHLVFRQPAGGSAVPAEEGRLLADRLLRERSLLEDGLKFDLSFPAGGNVQVYRYLNIYQGFPLFNNFTNVHLHAEGIGEIGIYRLQPLSFSGREIQVVSAAMAVQTLLNQPGSFKAKNITDLSLGYYSQVYNAERWEIAPVWRFAAADGTVFYVNAFTGEAEHDL